MVANYLKHYKNQNSSVANRPQQQGAQGAELYGAAGGGAQQRHPDQTAGAGGVANRRSQQRHRGRTDLGGATGRSLNDGGLRARRQNMDLFRAGNCYKQGIAGQKRRHNISQDQKTFQHFSIYDCFVFLSIYHLITSLPFKDKILALTKLRKIYKINNKLETDIKNLAMRGYFT